jgi:predicted acyl esterase
MYMAARIYRPEGLEPFPTLFATSPYRYDNNTLPAQPMFLWRETGSIEWYVDNGYSYVHADVRGTGRSKGEFEFLRLWTLDGREFPSGNKSSDAVAFSDR